jgi:hypothetical protein
VIANERRRHGVVSDCYTWYTSIFLSQVTWALATQWIIESAWSFSTVRVAATDEMIDTH